MDITLHGHIDQYGNIRFDDESARRALLQPYNGRAVTVIIRDRQRRRTNKQNRYYWKVIIGTIAQYTGDEPERIHDALRLKFLYEPAVVEGGLDYIGRTSTMTTAEFREYVERIRIWALDTLGINLPEPNEEEITDEAV